MIYCTHVCWQNISQNILTVGGVSGLALHFQAAWTMAVRAVHLLTIKQTSCENNERSESNCKMWHRVLVEDWGGALVYREEKSVPKAVWCFYRPILFTAWGFTQSSVHWTSTRNNLNRKILDYKYFILAIILQRQSLVNHNYSKHESKTAFTLQVFMPNSELYISLFVFDDQLTVVF